MKTTILLLIFAISGQVAFSQVPVLTLANSGPQPGDVLTYYPADTANVGTGASGAGQHWDYSGLLTGTTPFSETYVDAGSAVPGANVAWTDPAGTFKQYFSINSSAYSLVAVSAFSPPSLEPLWTLMYADPQTLLTYPFTYPGSFTDQHAAFYTLPQSSLFRIGTSSTIADGYGTLVLPAGTFENVLRLKIVIDDRDSIVMTDPPLPFIEENHVEIFLWFDGIHKTPLLRIRKTAGTANGIVTYHKEVAVAAGLNGVAEVPGTGVVFRLYPDPAATASCAEFTLAAPLTLEFSLVSQAGTTVRTIKKEQFASGKHFVPLDVSGIAPGVYLVKCTSPFGESCRKLVVE
jgi:hypothetical protein